MDDKPEILIKKYGCLQQWTGMIRPMAVTVQRGGCWLFEPEKWNGSLLSTAPVLMFRQFGQIFYNFSAIIICCRFPIENLYSFLRKSILPVAKKLFNSFFLAKIFFSQREREGDFSGIFSYSIMETKYHIYLFFSEWQNYPISFSI